MHITAIPTHQLASYVTILLGDKEAVMEIDTGAAATLISEQVWRKLGSPILKPSNKFFAAYDGHRITPLGEWHCSVKYKDNVVNSAAITVVQAIKSHGFLGRDLLGALSLWCPHSACISPQHRLPS